MGTPYRTVTFQLQIDLHAGAPASTEKGLPRAIARALEHALDSDIGGAEALTHEVIGQISLTPLPTPEADSTRMELSRAVHHAHAALDKLRTSDVTTSQEDHAIWSLIDRAATGGTR